MGKSTLLASLRTFCSVYIIPTNTDYYCDWDDSSYDLAILDEFKGSKTVQWLNSWLDGNPLLLNKKGCSPITKLSNVPTIICSNFSLRDCYPNIDEARFATIDRRLTQVNVTVPIDINFSTS